MGVEGGTISAGGGGPSIGGGPTIDIGSTIVNEGPVAPKFLENTMPLSINKFNPIGEINFNPVKGKEVAAEPLVIQQAEEIAATAWENSEPVSVIEQAVVPSGIRQAEQVAAAAWETTASPAAGVEVEAEVIAQKAWENHPLTQAENVISQVAISRVAPIVDYQPVANIATSAQIIEVTAPHQQQVEQVLEEKKILTEKDQEDKPQAKRSEEQSVAKIKIVEAVRVSQLRRLVISEAARKVQEEAEQAGEKVVITAKKLKKFLSAELWKYISPLVGRGGYDGTIPLTLNAIEKDQTEYTNLQEAQTSLSQPVAEHIPLQEGEGGRLATVEEVREVLEGKEKDVLRSRTPAEIAIKRVVVKKDETFASTAQVVNTVMEEKEEVVGEPTLKSLGLEEVFQKAA